MGISYEPAAANSTPLVMLLDAQRTARFTTAEARRLCDQWNEGLTDHDGAGFRLPTDIEALLHSAAGKGWNVSRTGVSVRHPSIPELTVTIQLGGAMPGICSHAWYLLTFAPNATKARADAQRTLRQLSPGERRVALLVAEGLRNEEVAQRLQRSRRTVEYQLNVIFRKLDLTSRSQLVRALV